MSKATPQNWERVKEVFEAAIARPAAVRAAFLDQACAGDEALRREVESLLESDEQAGSFMDAPAVKSAAESLLEEQPRLSPGRQMGHYQIVNLIGEGGMGEVYLAEDVLLGRKVALKLLPAEFTKDLPRVRRFQQEARSASALNHPNIITIYEIGEHDSSYFIATEFIDGLTLRAKLQSGPLQLGHALDVAHQAALALTTAHEAKIIHRDIKPENIMLRRDGIVKVLDFGLAKLTEVSAKSVDTKVPTKVLVRTEPGRVMGTVVYMSPEQLRGVQVDARTDIWSLGVVLYEMISGQAPFAGETSSHVGFSILEKEPASLARYAPEVPAELQRIVRKALAKDLNDRYQTTRDLLIDLKNLRRELDLQSEMERSLAPDEFEVPPSGGQLSGARSLPPEGVTPNAPRTGVAVTPPTSSAEYLVSEIKRHKLGVGVGVATLIVVVVAVIFFAASWFRQRSSTGQLATPRKLWRLTFDAGLQDEPTWSPDGRFVAYSSDRSGNFDIWIKPLGEGDPIQVTKSPAHEWQPDWSPDGQHIAFRSEGEGGGLYVMPAFGGEQRKISSFGHSPHWSPDGSRILFFSTNARNVVSVPKVYVVELDGSPPREVLSEFLAEFGGRWQIDWHPDGQRVSIWGDHKGQAQEFWTIPLTGGAPVKSILSAEVEKQRLEAGIDTYGFRWSPSGRALYFEGISQGVRNLWKVEVDPQTLRWIAGPERLTTGAAQETNISLTANGKRLAFVSRSERTKVWMLPFDAANGRLKGPGQPITLTGVNIGGCDLTRDGKKLVCVAQRAGKRELWMKSFEDGSERPLRLADKFQPSGPRWSRDGLRVAYVLTRPLSPERVGFQHVAEHGIAFTSVNGGDEQWLTSVNQLQGWPWEWTADQQWILGSSARQLKDHWGLYLFPIAAAPQAENQMRLVTERAGYNAFVARFSPNERWICFKGVSTTDEGDSDIYVVPAAGGEWRRITEDKSRIDWMHWSPDGRVIYFASERLGFYNVWGRRFDPQTGQPIGEPFRVTSFESPAQMLSHDQWALAGDRLVLPIMEASGNIWILEDVDR